MTLASMARFVIADLTDARSVLMELGAIVPQFPLVAVRLMIKKSEHEHGMLDSIRCYRSVVENTYAYENVEDVIATIKENVVGNCANVNCIKCVAGATAACGYI